MTGTATPAARRPRTIPLVPIVIIVAAFFAGMFGASRLSTMLNSHTVSWGPSAGIGGPGFDRATAQTSTVVNVEVQWPSCVNTGDDSWLTPEVSYMPWSVTITLRTSAAYAANPKCSKPGPDGKLPMVGFYLSALSFPVHLSEPLGNRPLLDGSTSPATERYRP
ncbi:MAG TPA: hypothetical protein VFY18_01100 [Candidatus Limnocylindrales bacterium]|nr:hypothetical protein [Candidatus Limnocylindrales bacterium]